jgi:hypothetical protein
MVATGAGQHQQPIFPPFEYANIFDKANFGDWRDELARDGVVVLKERIPRARALEYREKAFQWLETFGLGFKRDDESTWTNEHMPTHIKGGEFFSRPASGARVVLNSRPCPRKACSTTCAFALSAK